MHKHARKFSPDFWRANQAARGVLRTRVSFRVLLSRDFSRLPRMESLLAGYLRMVSIINVIIVVNQVSVIIKILTDVLDVIFFIITITIIAIKTVRFTSSSSSLAYDHILAYLLKTSLHHYYLRLATSRLRPKARGQKRATSSSSSSLVYDHILAYLLKTSLHHYYLRLATSRLRPKARGQKRATKSRNEHRTSMNRKQALRKSIMVYHYINI